MPKISDPRLEAFAVAYANTRNHPQAAHLAGYPPGMRSEVLLKKGDVVARVQEIWGEQFAAAEITPAMVMQELRRVAFQDIRPIFDANGNLKPVYLLDDDTAATISAVDVEVRWEGKGEDAVPITTRKVRRVDKMAALGILAKHFKIVGDDNEGVNALASALADRLKAGRMRRFAQQNAEATDATYPARAADATSLPALPEPVEPIDMTDPRIMEATAAPQDTYRPRIAPRHTEEQEDERLW